MDNKLTTIKERCLLIADYKRISKEDFCSKIGMTYGNFKGSNKNTPLNSTTVANILSLFPDINPDWLLTGEPPMLKSDMVVLNNNDKNLIPYYDDVITVGGVNSISASMDGNMPPSEWIDAGDWFRDATAAIRHYGESMAEYPSGCILALRQINNINMLVWGKNYCIETSEFRITKRLQKGNEKGCYMAYSTNTETYPDGQLIHEPVTIPVTEIKRIFLVLGSVVKEQSSGPVYIKQ